MNWFCRPGEAGFPRSAGQPDPGDELVPGAHGILDEPGINLDELELAAADQPHRAVVANVAPGEKQVAVVAGTAHVRPAEVEAVRIPPHGDRRLPARRRRITGHRVARPPGFARYGQRRPLLARGGQPDMKVAVPPAVVRREGEPGQVDALDHHGERPELRRWAAGGTA